MQVTRKTTYVIYPVYASREINYSGTTFTRSELTPVDVEIAGIPIPGMHSVPMTVWELDEGFSSNLFQYFTTAEDMWLYLENLGFDRQTIKNYNFHYLPYKTPTLAKGWLDTNAYKDKMEELAPQVQYYPAASILSKSQNSGMVPNLYIENTVWGGYIGLCPRSASKTSQVWGTERLQFFNITDSPADTDPLVSEGQRAIPPIIGTGPIGTNNYSVGPKYAGISSSQTNRTGVSIPILYKAPIPGETSKFYYGVILYGYRYNDNRYFLYTKAFGYTSSSTYSYTVYSTTQADMHLTTEQIDAFFNEAAEYVPPAEDPWEDQAESEIGGGDGTFDWDSTPVEAVTVEEPAVIGTSLMHVYRVDKYLESQQYTQNVQDALAYLSAFLWSNDLKTAIRDSNDSAKGCIVSLHELPFEVAYTGDFAVIMGNITHTIGTGDQEYYFSLPRVVSQFQTVHLGELTINEKWGGYPDYAPHTQIQIFLPFIGFKSLNVNEVMGKTIKLDYTFDVLTGECTAILYIQDNGNWYNAYQWNGFCALSFPVSGAQYTQKLAAAGQMVGGAISVLSGIAGNGAGAVKGIVSGLSQISVANNVQGEQHHVVKDGSLGGAVGWMGGKQPFLVIESPRICQAKKKLKIQGDKLCRSLKVSDCSGFTVFDTIHLESLHATKEEKELLEQMLKGGVIL